MAEGRPDFSPFKRERERPTPNPFTTRPWELGAPSEGFQVVATGEDTLLSWMRLKQRIEDSPFIASDPMEDQLGLGNMLVVDGTARISVRLSFENGAYTLDSNTMLGAAPSALSFDGPPGMVGINLGSLFGGGSRGEGQFTTPLTEIETQLRRRGLEVFQNNGDLKITRPSASHDDPDDDRAGGVYTLHPMSAESPLPLPALDNILCFHAEPTEFDEDARPGGFEADYQEFAKMYEIVVQSMLQARGIPIPNEQFVIQPPNGLQRAVAGLEKKIAVLQKQIGMSTGGDLDAEVDRMILKERPDVRFEDVGGLTVVKDELANVVLALKSPELFTHEGTHPPRGVLLYGEPGVGKTLVAKALAAEAEADFYVVRIGDVLHSLYGKTERVIQSVFDRANENGASVIFIDEIDALAAHRDRSTEVTSRIVSVLLTNMDGLEERGKSIIVVGATNRLDAIDTALLRPGRFDLQIEVPLPTEAERSDIFSIHMRRANEIARRDLFEDGFDMSALSRRANHFSGADIAEVVRRTLVKRVKPISQGQQLGPVRVEDIIEQVERHREFLEKRKQSGSTGQYI